MCYRQISESQCSSAVHYTRAFAFQAFLFMRKSDSQHRVSSYRDFYMPVTNTRVHPVTRVQEVTARDQEEVIGHHETTEEGS